jgi:mannose-6-phosphate isomerase-like protein (cupin superfamily)
MATDAPGGGCAKSRYADVEPYITKDGSEIRELMHPAVHGNRAQSLAEAIVPVGGGTLLHRHRSTEEIYHVTHGRARLTLGHHVFEVGAGDTICIPPGVPHRLENTGSEALRVLCASTPAYSHADTEIVA